MRLLNSIKKQIKDSNDIKVLVENFFSLSTIQIFGYILPLITLPYLVRVVGVDKFGIISFSMAFMAYFQIITDYGFSLSATKEISINRKSKNKLSEIFNSVMIVKLILLILSFVILFFSISLIPQLSSESIILIFAFGVVIGNFLFPIWFFQGMENMKYITFINILSNLIFTISIFIIIKNEADYIYVPLLYSIGSITSGLVSLFIVYRNYELKIFLPPLKMIRNTFKDSTQFFLSRASVSMYTISNTFFLGLFTNSIQVGYYSAAEKIYSAFKNLFYPLVNSIYPHMASKRNKKLFFKLFRISLIISLIASILLFIFSELIINLLFGPGFQESVNILRIFCIALIIVVPSILLGYPFLAALGYQKYANGSIIIGSIIHLSALIILSQYYFNVYTVTILVVFTEFIILITRLHGIEKNNLWK